MTLGLPAARAPRPQLNLITGGPRHWKQRGDRRKRTFGWVAPRTQGPPRHRLGHSGWRTVLGAAAVLAGRGGLCSRSSFRRRAAAPAGAEDPAPGRRMTPLWMLKATQLLIFAANVCLARYITVYYSWIGLSREMMSVLLLTFPVACFFGQLFWSAAVDRLGEYKRTMILTSVASILVVFAYLLPAVQMNFKLLVCITASFGFFSSPSGPLVDALCLKVLAERPNSGQDYGDQRLWSAVGWGGMALLAGELLHRFGVPAMFFCYAVIVGINVNLIAAFMPRGGGQDKAASSAQESGKDAGNFLSVLKRFEVMWLLMNLIIYGMLMSLVEQFLNVFIIQDCIGSTEELLGFATATMCLFEIPVFKYISRVWQSDRMGPQGVIFATECVLAVRCLLYAILPRDQPWLILLVEPLHGFTFAGMWCATVEAARRLAPPGTEAKMQALLNGLFYQISFGVGAWLWGFWVPRPPRGIGFSACFIADAALTVGWVTVWYAVVLHRRRQRQ